MKGHVDKKDAILYVYDMLPKTKRQEIDLHITTCSACMLYITKMENKRLEACKRIRSLFEDAYKDRLSLDDARFWDSHLKYCNRCFDEYREFIDKKEKGVIRVFMGYISGLVKDVKEYAITTTVPVLEGKTKKDSALDIAFVHNLSKGGVNIAFITDKKGKIKAYLSSDRFNISGVTVSLAYRTKKGYITFAVAITDKKGIADLGDIKDMEEENLKRKLAVILTDVTEK